MFLSLPLSEINSVCCLHPKPQHTILTWSIVGIRIWAYSFTWWHENGAGPGEENLPSSELRTTLQEEVFCSNSAHHHCATWQGVNHNRKSTWSQPHNLGLDLYMTAWEKIPGPGEEPCTTLQCSRFGARRTDSLTFHWTDLPYQTSSPSTRTTLYTRPSLSLVSLNASLTDYEYLHHPTLLFRWATAIWGKFNRGIGECILDTRTPWPRQRTRRTLTKGPRTRRWTRWWSLRTTRTAERRRRTSDCVRLEHHDFLSVPSCCYNSSIVRNKLSLLFLPQA